MISRVRSSSKTLRTLGVTDIIDNLQMNNSKWLLCGTERIWREFQSSHDQLQTFRLRGAGRFQFENAIQVIFRHLLKRSFSLLNLSEFQEGHRWSNENGRFGWSAIWKQAHFQILCKMFTQDASNTTSNAFFKVRLLVCDAFRVPFATCAVLIDANQNTRSVLLIGSFQ